MATINNRATVSYVYGDNVAVVLSNLATTTLSDPITASKSSLGTTYRAGDEITYIITAQNGSTNALSNLTIVDNLGTNTVGTLTTTPLSYVGPAYLYVNGAYTSELTPVTGTGTVTFTVTSLAAGANAVIVYKAALTEYAPLEQASTITNTASFTADSITETVTASATVTVENYADLSVAKNMTPNPVVDGGTITYTFTLYNYGNQVAEDAVLTDTFSPAPTISSVTIDGSAVAQTSYTYTGGTLTLPATGSPLTISVPAATFTTDATTGVVSTTPGTTTVIITGTI